MDRWPALRAKLVEILGSENVYYNPPSNKRINYDAIRVTLDDIEQSYADNIVYARNRRYQLTYMGYLLKDEVINKLLDLPHASFDRSYKDDNLDHYVIHIYW